MDMNFKKKMAQFIFEHCGTSEQPSEQRAQFFSFINNYTEACGKEAFIKNVKEFLTKQPHVESLQIHGETNYDDEGGTYLSVSGKNIIFTEQFQKDNPEEIDQEEDTIRECIYDQELDCYLLDREFLETILPLTLSLDTIENLKNKIFSKDEIETFSMVEHYEKNLLEEQIQIASPSNKSTRMKV